MELNRSLMITILLVVLAICTGIVLSGCASIGKGKEDAGPAAESPQRIENQSTAVEETSGSSAEVRMEPVVYTGGSGGKTNVQAVSRNTDKDVFTDGATSLKQALERILPTTLPEMNWNRIGTVLAGILFLSMIYGLAFGIGRLSARRRDAGRRRAVAKQGSTPEARSLEPAYGTS